MRTTSASTCTPQTARGMHTFKIDGYSIHKGLGAGKFIRSTAFVGRGYQWCIRYYPNRNGSGKHTDHAQAYLELVNRRFEVRALFDFRLVDHATGKSTPMHLVATSMQVFRNSALGTYTSMTKKEIEASSYLWNDCLIIEYNVTVIVKDPVVEETSPPPPPESSSRMQVPLPDLSNNLHKLLEEKRESDVTFTVKGEMIFAHKIIVATRSPVFNAEFYGPMAKNTKRHVDVEDVEPDAFRALLHFIYTDSMTPAMDGGLHGPERTEMVKRLLVAAGKYGMERLKLMCEDILSRSLDVNNVTTILSLTELHRFSSLRDACVEFIASTNRAKRTCTCQKDAQLS